MRRKRAERTTEIKKDTKQMEKSREAEKRILKRKKVEREMNTDKTEGKERNSVRNMKTEPRKGFMPVTNMW